MSEANNGSTYTNLSEALSAVPVSKRTGGLTIKFIKNTPATYSVLKTNGVAEQPTGTELDTASFVESGTYDASQLSDFAELPTSTGSANAVTYYVSVIVDETITYTTWVITKATNDIQEYVQYRLMSTAWSTKASDWQGVDSEPVFKSKNLVESGAVKASIEKLAIETTGRIVIEVPVVAGAKLNHTVDLSALDIKSGTKVVVGFNSTLVDNKGFSVYCNGVYVGTTGNGRGDGVFVLTSDLKTIAFLRDSTAGIIETGIVDITLVSNSSMNEQFTAAIINSDKEIDRIENTIDTEYTGSKSYTFDNISNETYYRLPFIPKKGDILSFVLTSDSSMRCQLIAVSKSGVSLWNTSTLTGTTATYSRNINDDDIDHILLYSGSTNTATEISIAVSNANSIGIRLNDVENEMVNIMDDITEIELAFGIPLNIKMDGNNFTLPAGSYNLYVSIPDGTVISQNLNMYDSQGANIKAYNIRRIGDFSIDVPTEAASMRFYIGSQDTTGKEGVATFTRIKDDSDVVYVDPVNGSDTATDLVKTLGRAMTLNKKTIILKDGVYDESSISITDGVKIMAEHTGKAVFVSSSNIVLTSDGNLVSGSSKVYQINVDASVTTLVGACRFIYQMGIDDPQTVIDNDYRLPVHRDLDYRCDFAAIRHLSSIEAVENADYASFYIDTENNILYYSRPSDVNSSNYLFAPGNISLFTSGSVKNKCFEIQGLRIYGLVLSLDNSINCKVTDCNVFACRGGGCVTFDGVTNLHLLRCEAARGEMSYSATTGDGFNSHNSTTNRSIFTLEECWSHDNFNDGYSDHELSEGNIKGGVYEYNCISHGGGLTPAFGAKDTIDGVVCQCNSDDGIRYTGAASSNTVHESLVVRNTLIRNNTNNGFAITTDTGGNVHATFFNVLSYDNGNYGFKNVGNSKVTCLNCKAVGNHGGDEGYDFYECENR